MKLQIELVAQFAEHRDFPKLAHQTFDERHDVKDEHNEHQRPTNEWEPEDE